LAIARQLLERKLDGQAQVLARLPDTRDFIAWIEQARAGLADARTPAALRVQEAQAANAYWSAWSSVRMQFARRDELKLPAHWPIFLTRSSPISGVSRNAGDPINAVLNYSYRILETEVRLAVLTIGLDPGMGILHADQKSRDSFVYDVIEPLRPVVDGYVLTLLAERTFSAAEFFEGRNGICRLMPPLTTALAEAGPQMAKVVGPVVEQVAQRLVQGQGASLKPIRVPTLLSQANRSASRVGVRTSSKQKARYGELAVPSACRECGVIVADVARGYCDACLPTIQARQSRKFGESGRARLAELRAAGREPSRGGEARKKRGEKISRHMKEQAAWEAENGTDADPEVFRLEILPTLQGISLSKIAGATGMSQSYCSTVRRGIMVPHARHWAKLRSLVSDE
jgi:hypothetical protein